MAYTHELINPPSTYPSRLTKPIDVIHHRLKRESGDDGILKGLKVLHSPIVRVEGKDQLPNVCMVEYMDQESPWAGAKTNNKMSSNNIELQVTASFMLSFPADDGNYAIPLNEQPWGMLNWIERFKDTLEIGDDGQVDATLEMSCIRPFYCHVRESDIMDLSWSILIDVELYPMAIQRGTRRFGWKLLESDENSLKIPT